MISIWNKNISLFKNRFPALYETLVSEIPNFLGEEKTDNEIPKDSYLQILNEQFPFYKFSLAKNGALTTSENSLAIHSAYNPQREAEQAAEKNTDTQKEIFIFAGIGLGYLPQTCAKKFPQKTFVVLEPDAPHFFAALACLDFEELFKIEKLFFIIGASEEQAASLVENAGGFENAQVFLTNAQAAHAEKYFEKFFSLEKQNAQKSQVNTNTLERFGTLWLKNSARNLLEMQRLCGANIFFDEAKYAEKNSLNSLPSVILAAGPSLEKVLPHLAKIKERAILIALDTSLRTVLRAGVEPDFIVLTDPQFQAAQHIAGLSSPSSILILESAVYPSAFRFDCRKKILISSLFPLGKFIESRLGKKGELSSGGSVATTAWEFARAIGSEKIFFAGLDLGFPQKKTHTKGSTFEEAAHIFSTRTNSAESALCKILFSAKNKIAFDYDGKKIITDERMTLFANWFENKIAAISPEKNSAHTFTFSREGLFINGIDFFPLEEFLEFPKITEQKKDFFEHAEKKNSAYEKNEFDAVIEKLKNQFEELKKNCERAKTICNDILCGDPRAKNLLLELDSLDKEILSSDAKNVAALVFPTQRRLDEIFAQTKIPGDALLANATKSRVVYAELLNAIELYLKYLR